MHAANISIATITWARDVNEEKLLRSSLTQLAALELPVFVCDGGSGESFIEFIGSFPQFTMVPRKAPGVWWQVKSSIDAAYESASEYIFYTEPDKLDFFRKGLPKFIDDIDPPEKLGVYLAARSKEAFKTFPDFQQSTETSINGCCAEVVGKALDFTYGPFLFRRELVTYLGQVNEDIGWGWRPFVFGMAKRAGYEVLDYVGDFPCPLDQRQDSYSERIYRMRQLSQNINGIILSATMPVLPA